MARVPSSPARGPSGSSVWSSGLPSDESGQRRTACSTQHETASMAPAILERFGDRRRFQDVASVTICWDRSRLSLDIRLLPPEEDPSAGRAQRPAAAGPAQPVALSSLIAATAPTRRPRAGFSSPRRARAPKSRSSSSPGIGAPALSRTIATKMIQYPCWTKRPRASARPAPGSAYTILRLHHPGRTRVACCCLVVDVPASCGHNLSPPGVLRGRAAEPGGSPPWCLEC